MYFFRNTFRRPDLFDLANQERFGTIYHHPSDMCVTDRVMLYALVRGLRPERSLEIGARWGGSARIIAAAMEENGLGKLVGIDIDTSNFRARKKDLFGRYQLMRGSSPEAIPDAVGLLGGPLDFVLIDATHTYDSVLADLRGVIPLLADGGHILCHDAFHQGINAAVHTVLKQHTNLIDCGFITRNPSLGQPVSYCGFRLIRAGDTNSLAIIADGYTREGMLPTPFSTEYWNFDEYAIRMGFGGHLPEADDELKKALTSEMALLPTEEDH